MNTLSGKCDFERLQSMEGVYVANYYENTRELEMFDSEIDGKMVQYINGDGQVGRNIGVVRILAVVSWRIVPSVHLCLLSPSSPC